MKTHPGMRLGIGCWLAGCGLAALAADTDASRDPMQPPPAAALPAAAASSPGGAADEAPNYILVVGNARHVVDRGRRLSVGDLLAGGRIACIDDDAVWLRDAQGLRRMPLYPGITRHPTDTALPIPAPTRTTAKDHPR